MPLPYDNLTLTQVINKRRPVVTPILDTHFTRRRVVPTSVIQMDIITGPEGIMIAISREAASRKAERRAVESKTFMIPRFSEHDFVTASDQLLYRAPGVINGGESFDMLINDKLDTIRSKGDRTKEVMSINAMRGSVIDGDGNVIATYDTPTPVDIDFSTADPVIVYDNANVAISRALGRNPAGLVCYCGLTAYQRLWANPKVQDLIKGPAGPQMMESGELRLVGGVTIRRLTSVYVNNAGTEVPFMPDAEMIVVAADADFELIHGPCSAAGGRLALIPWYVQQTEEDDPPSTKVRGETNPLTVVNRPEAIYRINTTG